MNRAPPLAMLVGAAAAQHLVAPNRPKVHAFRALLAGSVAAASAGMLSTSVAEFRRHRTTVNPVNPDWATTLVTGGPHSVTRNPMYVGMAGLLTAHALARGSRLAVLPAVGFVAAINHGQIPAEEAALRERFGEQFDDYAKRVPRWLGLAR